MEAAGICIKFEQILGPLPTRPASSLSGSLPAGVAPGCFRTASPPSPVEEDAGKKRSTAVEKSCDSSLPSPASLKSSSSSAAAGSHAVPAGFAGKPQPPRCFCSGRTNG
ncbi:hypothetical protein ABZP36_013813 [Zizania latifolia]